MPEMKNSTIFRHVLCCLTVIIVLIATNAVADPPAMADLYRIDGVTVDIPGNAAARDRAVEEAQKQAFRTLLGRLTVARPAEASPEPTVDEMPKLVQDIDIVSEKISPAHYLATVNVRFRPEASRNFLRDKGYALAEAVRAPIVVMPIWQQDGRKKLWDVGNPWLAAWRQRGPDDPLLPIILPVGGIEDVTLGTADEILAGKPETLNAFRQQYQADSVLVVAATLRESDRRLAVEFRDFGLLSDRDGQGIGSGFGNADRQSLTIPAMAGESDDDVMRRALQTVLARVKEQWKQSTAINLDGGESAITVTVPVRGIEDWIAIQRRLNSQKNVFRADVLALSTQSARLLIHHYGTTDQLRLLMAQYGLELAPIANRIQAVLVPATGTDPMPVAGVTAPPYTPITPPTAIPTPAAAAGAAAAPQLSAEPEWKLLMRDRAL
jgi:hypothetical protein